MTEEQPIKILIVEDQFITAKGIQKSLEGLGYEVVGITSNEADTLKIIEETSPNLVLMDIKLKGEEDGVTITYTVQSQYNIPVVFLSAYTDDETIERVYHVGAYGFVVKPYKDIKLKEAIDNALYRHKAKGDVTW